MNYINKLYKFMYGRYGIDNLYRFLGVIYLILILINIFIKSNILTVIELILVFIIIYRVFSKNITKRKKENELYLKIKNKIINIFNISKTKITKKEYHIYKKCPKCKTTLRLPLPEKRGIHHVKCPKCKKRITIFTLRKEKIEIIRKKAK